MLENKDFRAMTTSPKRLRGEVFVSGQIAPREMGALAEQGFALVVNHRPDGEEPGQPTSAQLAESAAAAGLNYVHLPVRAVPDAVSVAAATGEALAGCGEGKTLMFCRSGLRSCAAWAFGRRAAGEDAADIRTAAAGAGYDLGGLPL